jgi:hypothetical protein
MIIRMFATNQTSGAIRMNERCRCIRAWTTTTDLPDRSAAFVGGFVLIDRPGLSGAGYCALQLWTQNNVYDVDWSMHCFRVANKDTGDPIVDHPFLGARLNGGQKQDGDGLELTYPIPRPGSIAVFELPDRYVTTSEVVRVVLRVRVIAIRRAHGRSGPLSIDRSRAGPFDSAALRARCAQDER